MKGLSNAAFSNGSFFNRQVRVSESVDPKPNWLSWSLGAPIKLVRDSKAARLNGRAIHFDCCLPLLSYRQRCPSSVTKERSPSGLTIQSSYCALVATTTFGFLYWVKLCCFFDWRHWKVEEWSVNHYSFCPGLAQRQSFFRGLQAHPCLVVEHLFAQSTLSVCERPFSPFQPYLITFNN